MPLPSIWVLLGAHAGDNAQAVELARRLDGHFEARQLVFNSLSRIPNALLGTGFKTLAASARNSLAAPWPDLVIATGRRAAPVSLGIKQRSGGRTLAVHIGRPRLALARFDLVLTTQQYGLPPDKNVVHLDFPFSLAKQVSDERLRAFREMWAHLPRPWIVGVIGAAKFPLRFATTELADFAQKMDSLAQTLGGSAILMDSPRSTPGAIAEVAARMIVPRWCWTRGEGDNPYHAALQLADCLTVTSDSVSMVAEMVQTGTATYVYHLPRVPMVPAWQAHAGPLAALARRGLLSPPRSVAAYLKRLSDRGWIGNLNTGQAPRSAFEGRGEHDAAVARVVNLLSARAKG